MSLRTETDSRGIVTVSWDPSNKDEVRAAEGMFKDAKKIGFKVFSLANEVKQFDPGLRVMSLMAPHLAKEKAH